MNPSTAITTETERYPMAFQELWQLRAAFAIELSEMYGEEVPAYNTLVDVSTEVNRDSMERVGANAERLGSIERVTAERHGAIRVGSPTEMSQVARVYAAFGMYPVGFYDLRDASASSDRKSTRLNSSHVSISYAVFCLKKKRKRTEQSLLQ